MHHSVTPLKKLRLSPAFATQKRDGGKDDRHPVKVISDDAHEEEPAAREVSCCMVNYSPFASPAVLLPHHGVHYSFSSHGLLCFDTLTAAQQNVVGEGKEDQSLLCESHHCGYPCRIRMVSSMLCCITSPLKSSATVISKSHLFLPPPLQRNLCRGVVVGKVGIQLRSQMS